LNLITVATIEEFRPQLNNAIGIVQTNWFAILMPWVIFFIGVGTAGFFSPSGTDNQPIRTHDLFDVEEELSGV
ncbi:MAG: hypothetical protein KAT44_10465, partial [Pirellulales bacterium]|nr:hypothetical protein [Pirellulales bacterium]